MIKIVQSTYGYLDKNGVVKPKTSKDEPFELTEEQEARLVDLGVAEYVNTPAQENGQENGQEGGQEGVQVTGHLDPEQLAEWTNAQLKELAEEMGIDTKKLTTKAKLIEAIVSVEVTPGPVVDGDGIEDTEDDGEQPPTFDAAEAVE